MSASRVASASRSNSASNSDNKDEHSVLFTSSTLKTKTLKSGTFVVNSANRRMVDPILYNFILAKDAYILPSKTHLFDENHPGMVYNINTLYDWFIKSNKKNIPHTNEDLTAGELLRLKSSIYNLYSKANGITDLDILMQIYQRSYYKAGVPFKEFLKNYDLAKDFPRQASNLLSHDVIRELRLAGLL